MDGMPLMIDFVERGSGGARPSVPPRAAAAELP